MSISPIYRRPIMPIIAALIADLYGVSRKELLAPEKPKLVTRARQHAFYEAFMHGKNAGDISRYFGQERTTVIYGIGAHMARHGIDGPARRLFDNKQHKLYGSPPHEDRSTLYDRHIRGIAVNRRRPAGPAAKPKRPRLAEDHQTRGTAESYGARGVYSLGAGR
jgi:hypothetical protein